MDNVEIYINDDYATLSTYNYGFYYGYEFDKKEYENGDTDEVFGFEVCEEEKIGAFRISYKEMQKHNNCPEQWQCDKCLLFGIGLWLEHKKSGVNK